MAMRDIRNFFVDYYRLMAGRPLLGMPAFERTGAEIDARSVGASMSRGNVALGAGRFVSEQDMEREFAELKIQRPGGERP